MALDYPVFNADIDYMMNTPWTYGCFDDEDLNINETIEKYVICSVCYGLPRQPCVGSCGHVLCRECYLKLTTQITNPTMTCPVCRLSGVWTYSTADFYISIIHLRLYNEFTDVKCANGCGFHGPVPRVIQHEKYLCPQRYLLCPFKGCNFVGPAHFVRGGHRDECEHVLQVCSLCLTPQLNKGTHNCLNESIKERERMFNFLNFFPHSQIYYLDNIPI